MKLKEIKEKAKPILDRHNVSEAAIFGSYARGTQEGASDIDILVRIDEEMSLLDFVGLKQKLEDTLGHGVDLVEYSEIKPRLKKHILRDQIEIS